MNMFAEVISEFSGKLNYIYNYRTAGDFTFTGLLADFLQKIGMKSGEVYGLYDMKADSMNGVPSLISLHNTKYGAELKIPDILRGYEREPHGDYVADYGYMAIKKMKVEFP